MCNTSLFSAGAWNEKMQAYTFNYKTKFKSGTSASLFNRVVYPTDMTNADWQAIQGEFYIVVWAQAIQSEGFTNAESALANLSDAYVPTNISAFKQA